MFLDMKTYKGLPKPLIPLGGNLEYFTAVLASSALLIRGTIMPWAPASKAPLNPNRHDVNWLYQPVRFPQDI